MRFQQSVLTLVSKIPCGKVSTYKAIAKALGKPKAARAVGNALNANPFPFIGKSVYGKKAFGKNQQPVKIPCHRVVCSNGKVGGYAFGVKKKIALLESEGIRIKNSKVVSFSEKLWRIN